MAAAKTNCRASGIQRGKDTCRSGETNLTGRKEEKAEKQQTQQVADRCTMSMKIRFEANRVVSLATVSVVVSIEVRLRRRSR
jgi:hypothetical protein